MVFHVQITIFNFQIDSIALSIFEQFFECQKLKGSVDTPHWGSQRKLIFF